MRLLVYLIVIIGVTFVQASSPCDLVRCQSNHVCKEKAIVECQSGEDCQNKLSPVCVPRVKTGTCPRQDITEVAESNCENDSDCESNLKCCPATNKKSYCFRPCRKMFCKCGADMKMLEIFNSKGCAICSCVPRDDKRTVESTNDCLLPKETGKCRARFLRYYYNSETKQCEKFYYGGCSANKNNFFTKQACENKCLPEKKIETKCEQEPERGLCKGHLERFFFNKTANECQQFVYGGCRGNENNFETIDLCKKECDQPVSAASESVVTNKPKHFCDFSADSGPCFAHFEKYFFNKKSNKCEKFVYGGCLGNDNRFNTEEECLKSCLIQQQGPAPKCKLEKKPGVCEGYFERFFYNETAMECQKFVYGGCGGNENNFETEELCQQECLPLPGTTSIEPVTEMPVAAQDPSTFDINSCSLKKDIGPCLAYLEMYFFNVDTAKCERFVYGGCMGNENRFETLEECESSCAKRYVQEASKVCQLPSRMGTCRGHIERYYYNDTVKECQKFVYSGCDGNGNNFDTLEQCDRQCATASNNLQVCQLTKDSGPCYGYFEMFHYNAGSKRCEKFVYGGCGGNANKFSTEEECINSCQVAQETALLETAVSDNLDVCSMEKASGPCRGFYEKFFYNSTAKECQKFTYGGCMGNENNFDTKDECIQKCAPQKSPEREEQQLQPASINNVDSFNDDNCFLPSEPGQCFAYIPSFYFNVESGRCESFVYGGCGGNSNRFELKEECENACKKVNQEQSIQRQKEKCQMDVDPGMCRGYFEKYFYNQESKKCELFVYGGCGGNRNNFDSMQACDMECGSGSDGL